MHRSKECKQIESAFFGGINSKQRNGFFIFYYFFLSRILIVSRKICSWINFLKPFLLGENTILTPTPAFSLHLSSNSVLDKPPFLISLATDLKHRAWHTALGSTPKNVYSLGGRGVIKHFMGQRSSPFKPIFWGCYMVAFYMSWWKLIEYTRFSSVLAF